MSGSIQPKIALDEPNIRPKPTSQKQGVPMQKSIRFFIRILPVFLARVKPASHIEKPACIKNTNAAPIRTHIVFTELYINFYLLSMLSLMLFINRFRFEGWSSFCILSHFLSKTKRQNKRLLSFGKEDILVLPEKRCQCNNTKSVPEITFSKTPLPLC